MKNFAHEDPVNDTGVEIIDLDPSRKRSKWFFIGQRLSSRARLWTALFTLLSITVLGAIVLSPLLVHSSDVTGKAAEISMPITSGNDLPVISENTPGIVCVKTSSNSPTISYWVANLQISTNNRVILQMRKWVFEDKMTCLPSSLGNLHIIFFGANRNAR